MRRYPLYTEPSDIITKHTDLHKIVKPDDYTSDFEPKKNREWLNTLIEFVLMALAAFLFGTGLYIMCNPCGLEFIISLFTR